MGMLSHTVNGAEIRRLRELRGMKPADLAKAAGISREFVYKIEQRRKQPGADTAGRIATALGVQLQDLLVTSTPATAPAGTR